MRVIYGLLTLTYGLSLLIAAFAWRQIPWPLLRTNNALGISFAIAVVLSIPFLISYSRLGLNPPEGEEPSPQIKSRNAALRRECPVWPIAWYGGLGFVCFAWLGLELFELPIHPFFALSGVFSCLTGVWFSLAYPVAVRLFDSKAAE